MSLRPVLVVADAAWAIQAYARQTGQRCGVVLEDLGIPDVPSHHALALVAGLCRYLVPSEAPAWAAEVARPAPRQ